MTHASVSSPLSTGGSGTFFEQHVAAYWLAQLLVKAIPPIQIDTNVVEVSLQTEHLGWHTDDFLVTCEDAGGGRSRLAGQVKMTFTVSAADEECRKAILDFWGEAAWNDGGSPGALPRPLGFIPSSVRALLFPGARPDPLMDILGKFDTRTARGDIRFAFHVLKDGTVRQSTTPLQIESFNTRIYEKDIPAVEFRITVRNMLNAIDVYQAVLGAYDDNTAPLVITGNVPTEGQECAAQMAKPRRGRLTVFLDDNRQFAVTALLREVPRECKKSPEEWRWMFAEPPKITLSGADSA